MLRVIRSSSLALPGYLRIVSSIFSLFTSLLSILSLSLTLYLAFEPAVPAKSPKLLCLHNVSFFLHIV